MSPLCESYVAQDRLNQPEVFYPLHAYVCESCLLVQLEQYVAPENIFADYAYFSSYSESWVAHARRYSEAMIQRLALDTKSFVVELASNDGYLLQHFVRRGIPCLGVEPAANVAKVAIQNGVATSVRFFGKACAEELCEEFGQPDLLIGNNVLAHVPDLNDFVAGMKALLRPSGIITMEFPHLLQLVNGNQFDTIYHEHFSYFSFFVVEAVFARHGLKIFDVEELPTHGGSLRVFACHTDNPSLSVADHVAQLRARELRVGVDQWDYYAGFEKRVQQTKHKLLDFLIRQKRAGKRIVGYGAPGKGNTLLNYCGIRSDLLDYTVDRNPHKQGLYTPGTHIPILHPKVIRETRPDYVLILPWNLKQEITEQLSFIRDWGGAFVIPIPEVQVL